MPEIKLPKLPNRVTVKMAISVSPELNGALADYAALYTETYGSSEPIREVIPAILEAFLESDRAFVQRRRGARH